MLNIFEKPILIEDLPTDDQSSGAVPAGDYEVKIERASVEATKSGDGAYIKLMLRIIGPKSVNACIFANINVANRSETAERIGKQELRKIMAATGVSALSHESQFIDRRMMVKVTCVPDEYKRSKGDANAMKNEVKGYSSVSEQRFAQLHQPSPQQYHQPQPPAASATPQQQTSSAPVRPW